MYSTAKRQVLVCSDEDLWFLAAREKKVVFFCADQLMMMWLRNEEMWCCWTRHPLLGYIFLKKLTDVIMIQWKGNMK